MTNQRDDGPPRRNSLDMQELTPFERLFTMDICGVLMKNQKGLTIYPELVIRANRITGEISAACITDHREDDGA